MCASSKKPHERTSAEFAWSDFAVIESKLPDMLKQSDDAKSTGGDRWWTTMIP